MIPINPEAIGDPNQTPVVYLGEEGGKALGIPQRRTPPPWLVADDEADRARYAARETQIAADVPALLAELDVAREALRRAEQERDQWKAERASTAKNYLALQTAYNKKLDVFETENYRRALDAAEAATARAERAEHILQRVQAVADRGARVSLHRATWVSLDALLQALGGTDGES